jgi:thiol reductant ABC exporter CydC subunit
VPVVVLDEPSEDLDAATERIVARLVRALAGSATVVMATHSARLVAAADRLIELVDGQVVRVQRQVPDGIAAAVECAVAADHIQPASPHAAVTGRGTFEPGAAAGWTLRGVIREAGAVAAVVRAALLAGVAGLAGLGLTVTSTWLISRAAEHPNVQALALAVVGVRAFAVGKALLRYLERLRAHDVALRLASGLRSRVFTALGARGRGAVALSAPDRGETLRRFVGDVDGIQDALVRGVVPAAGAAATAVGAVLVCTLLVPLAGLLLAAAVLFGGVAVPVWVRHRTVGETRGAELTGERDGRLTRLVDGLAELEAYGAATHAVEEIHAQDDAVASASRRVEFAGAVGTALGGIAEAAALAGVLFVGALAVASGGLAPVALAVLAACVLVAFETVGPLPTAAAAFSQARAGLCRVAALIAAAEVVPAPIDPLPAPSGALGLRSEHLTVWPAVSAPAALRDVAFELAPHTSLAVTGPSGCGKTSLLRAVLGLAPATGRLDVVGERTSQSGAPSEVGVALAGVGVSARPGVVAGSLQGDHVFDATLRDNLRVVAPEATDEDLDGVARSAGLLPVVRALPRGWSTPAGVDGALLSGGQRQRLLLARALLADPQVLLLDEPTAHLDAETEAAVLADLFAATTGRTVLLSTHRHAAARLADAELALGADGLPSASASSADPHRDPQSVPRKVLTVGPAE